MNYKPEIAIIEPNTLCSLGLKSILEEIIPISHLSRTEKYIGRNYSNGNYPYFP